MRKRYLIPILLLGGISFAETFYVATNGSNSAVGSLSAPWQTIQYAVDHAGSNGTVCVRGGVYAERVVLTRSGFSLQAYGGETAILDGSGFVVGNGWDVLLDLNGQDDLTVEGLEFQNLKTSARDCVPIGVLVHGDSKNIVLKNLIIHDIETTYSGKNGGDAHGLAVYGTSGTSSISNLLIDAVEIYDCKLGSSESLVLNGNVEDFSVRNGVVHDNNNIGIDFIGHEGTCPVPGLDQARNGRCVDNHVYNITTVGNPAYGTDRSSDGIYVDGGTDIVIERNRVHDGDIGIEIASEHSGESTSYITVRNNVVYQNYTGGIFVGGYDSNRGRSEYCAVVGNTLWQNDTGKSYNGEIYLQMYVENCVFENNLIMPLINGGGDVVFLGGIGGSGSAPVNTVFDHNLYYSPVSDPDAHLWTWGNHEYYAFSVWQGTGQDAQSTHGLDPQLRSPENGNVHLQSTSPAINGGTNQTEGGAFDFDGQVRVFDGLIDIGADEYVPYTTNGTPIAWLEQHGWGDGRYEVVDRLDTDGDGFAAWQEYQAGTDPTNSASLFKIIELSSNHGLVWLGGTNELNIPFVIWRSSDLGTNGWSIATNYSRLLGDQGTNRWRDPMLITNGPAVFYRVTAPAETSHPSP